MSDAIVDGARRLLQCSRFFLGSSSEKDIKISKPLHTEEEPDPQAKKQWKAGDKCLAIWSEDGQ